MEKIFANRFGLISQKTWIFIITDIRSSHLTYCYITTALTLCLFPLLTVAHVQTLSVYHILCIFSVKRYFFLRLKCVYHKSFSKCSHFILGPEVSWVVQYSITYTTEPIYYRLQLKGKWNPSLTALMMETVGSFQNIGTHILGYIPKPCIFKILHVFQILNILIMVC
jgi:hypothetical protein